MSFEYDPKWASPISARGGDCHWLSEIAPATIRAPHRQLEWAPSDGFHDSRQNQIRSFSSFVHTAIGLPIAATENAYTNHQRGQYEPYMQPLNPFHKRNDEHRPPPDSVQAIYSFEPRHNLSQRIEPRHDLPQYRRIEPRHDLSQYQRIEPRHDLSQYQRIEPRHDLSQYHHSESAPYREPLLHSRGQQAGSWRAGYQVQQDHSSAYRNSEAAQNVSPSGRLNNSRPQTGAWRASYGVSGSLGQGMEQRNHQIQDDMRHVKPTGEWQPNPNNGRRWSDPMDQPYDRALQSLRQNAGASQSNQRQFW